MDKLADALINSGILDTISDIGINEEQLMDYIDVLNNVENINPVSDEDISNSLRWIEVD